MYACMHVWMYEFMYVWMDGWMDACMHYVEDLYIALKLQIQCFKRLEACQATQRVERHLCLGSLSQADGAGIGEKNV